uniref:KRAB domain-containing protein n=1 Tax=Laticauda laticaudata TaxID=8630 RepID=A0A8C5RJ07_LATLA
LHIFFSLRLLSIPNLCLGNFLVSFEEVAVCFSKEEWTQLNPHQKALHGEVMRENLRNVASLGKALWPKANHTKGGIQHVLTSSGEPKTHSTKILLYWFQDTLH